MIKGSTIIVIKGSTIMIKSIIVIKGSTIIVHSCARMPCRQHTGRVGVGKHTGDARAHSER